MDKGKKKNVADTSIRAYKELLKTGQLVREKDLALTTIEENQPVTSRGISYLTGIEIGNITRSIYNLVNTTEPKIRVCQKAKCPTTGKTVKWYSLANYHPQTTV